MDIGLKILGFLVLALGISIMIASLYYSYKIFTGKIPAPQVFSEQDFSVPREERENRLEAGSEQEIVENMLREQIDDQFKKIAPAGVIAKLLNLLSWSIFTGIAMFGGSRVAGTGISMIKSRKKKK